MNPWLVFALQPSLAQPMLTAETVVPEPACHKESCWSNYVTANDLDGDGDLDLVFANASGEMGQAEAEPIGVYLNDGAGGFSPLGTVGGGALLARARQVAVGDVDRDGDLDIYVPDESGGPGTLLVNDGAASFSDETAQRLPDLSPRAGGARFGDVDGDGDLDLLILDGFGLGDEAEVVAHLLVNDGSGVFEEEAGRLPDRWNGEDPNDVDFVDVDQDRDLDIVITNFSWDATLWKNDGSGHFSYTSVNEAGLVQRFSRPGNPTACDVDRDGDLDMWFDDSTGVGAEQISINDGTGHFTDETKARTPFDQLVLEGGITCADIDQDGDYDAIVWSLGVTERAYLNDGDGIFVDGTEETFEPVEDPTLGGDIGDFDGDGVLDAVTAQGGEGPRVNRFYRGTGPRDTRAPTIISPTFADEVPADTPTTWRFVVRDAVVAELGPRLARAFARGDFGAGVTEVDAPFVGGDLFQVVLPGVTVVGGWTTDVEFCAVDRAGNEGCSVPARYVVESAPPPPKDSGRVTDTGRVDSGFSPPPVSRDRCGCASAGRAAGPGGIVLLLFLGARRRMPLPLAT